jgi:hypothetical protein
LEGKIEQILKKLKEKGECELYSACPAPWIDGGAHIRISCLQGNKYQALFWLTGDKYSGKPTKDTLSSIPELEEYLKKYSFI